MKFDFKRKILFLTFLCYCSPAAPAAGTPIPNLLDAIAKVENSPPESDHLDKGSRAIGIYQIHKAYWQDAIEFDKSIGGKYEDCKEPAYAKRIVLAYLTRYAAQAIANKDYETLARIHNGGPHGNEKDSTLGYWRKVKEYLK